MQRFFCFVLFFKGNSSSVRNSYSAHQVNPLTLHCLNRRISTFISFHLMPLVMQKDDSPPFLIFHIRSSSKSAFCNLFYKIYTFRFIIYTTYIQNIYSDATIRKWKPKFWPVVSCSSLVYIIYKGIGFAVLILSKRSVLIIHVLQKKQHVCRQIYNYEKLLYICNTWINNMHLVCILAVKSHDPVCTLLEWNATINIDFNVWVIG